MSATIHKLPFQTDNSLKERVEAHFEQQTGLNYSQFAGDMMYGGMLQDPLVDLIDQAPGQGVSVEGAVHLLCNRFSLSQKLPEMSPAEAQAVEKKNVQQSAIMEFYYSQASIPALQDSPGPTWRMGIDPRTGCSSIHARDETCKAVMRSAFDSQTGRAMTEIEYADRHGELHSFKGIAPEVAIEKFNAHLTREMDNDKLYIGANWPER
ncbi:hypothetical protein ACQU0X_26965 [Pseudovibrio ascidiaceicola]|uniref:hypothetical protein n=1 Tax=Pseudovibrio ascidiaceicola TaxID=285279 RepID=UPI003D364D66